MIGKKQNTENSAWLDAMANIEQSVSFDDLEKLSLSTITDIQRMTEGKKAAYAWSAGKDSIVLGHLCERAGISDCMIGVCNLEYPAFMEWINENKPVGCEIVNTGQDIKWLAQHPDMLFPQGSATAAKWFAIVQHRAQRLYYKKHNLDIMALGRRRADGNYTGRGSNIYTDGQGVTRYSPLADWRHEDILAYAHYHKIPMPPIYGWKNGYLCGTHPWPARQWTGSIENGWHEVYEISPDVVITAAEHIESARHFIEGVAK